jgi:hypothetical protein
MEPQALEGSWTHSHEEDQDEVQVFRPGDRPLPPSRGRTSFTLRADGTADTGAPGPDDRGRTSEDGTWQLEGDVLTVRCPGWVAAYRVVAADPDHLGLRPLPSS